SSKAGRRKIVPSTATPPCIRRRVHTCCTPPWEVRGAPLTHQTTTRRDERTTLSRDVARPRPSPRSGDAMSRFLHKFVLRREVLLSTSRVVVNAVIRALTSELVSWLF